MVGQEIENGATTLFVKHGNSLWRIRSIKAQSGLPHFFLYRFVSFVHNKRWGLACDEDCASILLLVHDRGQPGLSYAYNPFLYTYLGIIRATIGRMTARK